MSISPHATPYSNDAPSFALSESHINLLVNTYADFFHFLRSNRPALTWILHSVFDTRPLADASHLDPSLARGYTLLHVCARPSCATVMPETLLQKTSTLLLPAHRRGQTVLGFFFDHTQYRCSSVTTHLGRYTYSSESGELLKCVRVEGSNPSSPTVIVSRMIIVDRNMFLLDTALLSFRYPSLTSLPENITLHSRNLSFNKLATLLQSPIAPHASLFGLADFGLYDALSLRSRVPPGMQQANPSQSIHPVYAHFSSCHALRSMLSGLLREELDRLRTSFFQVLTADARLPPQLPTIDTFAPPRLEDPLTPQTMSSQHQPIPYLPHSTQPIQLPHHLTIPAQLVHAANDTNNSTLPASDQFTECRFDSPRPSSNIRMSSLRVRTLSPRLLSNNPVHHSSSLPIREPESGIGHMTTRIVHDANPDMTSNMALRDSSQNASHMASRILPINTSDMTSSAAVQEPSSVVPRISTRVLPATNASTGTIVSGQDLEGISIIMEKPVLEHTVPPFKKTLPAPTKSEIVIRNRISAQRSNEKRRRRIENTKTELAYLKSAYLPSLQQKKGCLIEENQSLKRRFMQRYREGNIESFF